MSQADTQLDRYDPMPSLKRSRTNSYASGSRSAGKRITRIPRALTPGAGANRCIIPLTVDHDFGLAADPAYRYSWDTLQMWRNGANPTDIPGAAELATVFELVRLAKVVVTILPGAKDLDYNDQTVGTGSTNIPYVYEAVDYTDATIPTLLQMKQNPTCKTHSLSKTLKRTFYPRLEGANGVIDVGANTKNQFMKTGTASSQKWQGFNIYIDMLSQVWTYGSGRLSFKLYFECMQSK